MNTKRKKSKQLKRAKRKLSVAQRKASNAQRKARREATKERQAKYKWIFINGKQVRVKRKPENGGFPEDEWIRQNADPIFLVQNEMWESLDPELFNAPSIAHSDRDSSFEPPTGNNDVDTTLRSDEPPF